MKRLMKLFVALFVVVGVVVFATAMAGGLMSDSAFTEQAQGH